MELYNEEDKVEEKSKKPILVGILIILLVIVAIILIILIVYLNRVLLKVTIDGESNYKFSKLLEIETTETETTIYFPIKEIATYLGYSSYTGDYENKSEDSSKCYIDNGSEIAMFTVSSTSLIISRGDSDYEEYTLDEPVFEKNGSLYTTAYGLQKAFNVTYSYTADPNRMTIYTTPYLVSYYAQIYGIANPAKEFKNQKAILEGMLIYQLDDNSRKYGVINITTGSYALEPKYDSISYLPYTSEFLVQSSGKYGIMTEDSKVKIKIAYDSIEVMDNEKGLYLVKEGSLYGVINNNGTAILNSIYQQIGVDGSTFDENALDNQYVFFDKLIPVKYDGMWGFFDVDGNQVTEFEYTGIGCTTSSVTNTYPTVVIPTLQLIVVEKNKYYNLININGIIQIGNGFVLDSVYLRHDSATGENTYYMTYGGNTANIEETFKAQGY